MKTQRERHYVERMLSRRCYRSRYLLACEPSARSRLMARSVMNVAARGPRQSRLLGITNPDFLISRGHTQRVILRTLARAHIRVRYYQCGRGDAGRRRSRRLPVCRE